jgi:hypothetical protein
MDFEGNGRFFVVFVGRVASNSTIAFFFPFYFINSPKSLEDVGLREKWCIIRGTRNVHGWRHDFFCVLIRCCPVPGGQKNFA